MSSLQRTIACAALLAWAGGAAAAPSAQELLAASDAIRNPGKPFALTVTLVEYRNGRQADTSTLDVYSKADTTSGQRMVTGDAVNVASRLTSAAKGGEILIGRTAVEAAAGRLEVRPLPPLQVKGKSEPLDVYLLTGRKELTGAARAEGAHAI
jgi:class 3 adenylate cyclase